MSNLTQEIRPTVRLMALIDQVIPLWGWIWQVDATHGATVASQESKPTTLFLTALILKQETLGLWCHLETNWPKLIVAGASTIHIIDFSKFESQMQSVLSPWSIAIALLVWLLLVFIQVSTIHAISLQATTPQETFVVRVVVWFWLTTKKLAQKLNSATFRYQGERVSWEHVHLLLKGCRLQKSVSLQITC